MNIADLHPKYVTDASGKHTAVMLPIREFESLLEELEDLTIVIQQQQEETTKHRVFIGEMNLGRTQAS
ncbi:MAG: hypothetical protein VKJ86_07765 [Synechococcus sp.]|nr:hypothetical protein [Synechococcus sp.]